jgi:hypothetical protein
MIEGNIKALIPMVKRKLIHRLLEEQQLPESLIQDLQLPIACKIEQFEDYIHEGGDLAVITWNKAREITFYIDGLTNDLWNDSSLLKALIEHELLHIPTRYPSKQGPTFTRVPLYKPVVGQIEDGSQYIFDTMMDVRVDKFMKPARLQLYYDMMLFHQLLSFEYATVRRNAEFTIESIKQKVITYKEGLPVELSFTYPWVMILKHIYMWVVMHYHAISEPLLDWLYDTWKDIKSELVTLIEILYRDVLYNGWKDNYYTEFLALGNEIKKFGYMEIDVTVSLVK